MNISNDIRNETTLEHVDSVDSLRGIATLSVFIFHMWSMSQPEKDVFRPWFFLFAGHEAVILFYVLSGFVLTLSYEKKKPLYIQYFIWRLFRIYPAYYFCMVIEIIMFLLINPTPLNNYTKWFNGHFSTIQLNLKTFYDIFFLVTNPESQVNGVIWSLVYEVIISTLILPLFWKIKTNRTLIFIGCGYILFFFLRQVIHIDNVILDHSLYFSVFFYMGYLVFHFLDRLFYISTAKLLPLFLLCYASIYFTFGHSPFDKATIRDFLTGIASVYFICLALYSDSARKFLKIKILRFYGRISYSFYLFHICVMYSAVYLLKNIFPLWVIIGLIFIITTGVSYLVYRMIEKPFIRFGRIIAAKVSDPV